MDAENELKCPACEEGTCESHTGGGGGGGNDPAGGSPGGHARDDERGSRELRSQVARAVRRLNRAIKATRTRSGEPRGGDDSIEPVGEPPEPVEPAIRKRSDLEGFAAGIIKGMGRKRK